MTPPEKPPSASGPPHGNSRSLLQSATGASPVEVLFAGEFPPGRVRVEWAPDTRLRVPEVDAAIEFAWAAAEGKGIHLFDGPMCRLESWSVETDHLRLGVSHTSYKPFFGTNLSNRHFADVYGPVVLASPLGLSAALETADEFLMLGRRSSRVAYHPNRIHPFAGAMEPADSPDVFSEILRELDEEISLRGENVVNLRCVGLLRDLHLMQHELVFAAKTPRTRAQIELTLDDTEHTGVWSVHADAAKATLALREPALTPVAYGTILLWGRKKFGQAWFDDAAAAVHK